MNNDKIAVKTKKGADRALVGKRDVLLFIGLIALAAIIYASYTLQGRGAESVFARVSIGRDIVQTIDLREEGEFELQRNPNIRFNVQNGGVAFIESDCPDKICVHSGYLRYSGQMAACMPNRVALAIIGPEGESGVDSVAN